MAGSVTQASTNFFQTVRVRLVDQLGRQGPDATFTLPYARPAGPGTSTTTTGNSTTPTTTTPTTPAPPLKKTTRLRLTRAKGPGNRTVMLSGTVSVKTAKISIVLTRKGHKRIVRTLRAKAGRFALRIKHVPRGRWKLTLRYTGSTTTKAATAMRTITVR